MSDWITTMRKGSFGPFQRKTIGYMHEVEHQMLLDNGEGLNENAASAIIDTASKGTPPGNNPAPMPEDMDESIIETDSIWKDLMHQIYKDKKAFLGAIMVAIFVIVAIGAPIFAPEDPYEVDMAEMLVPPSFMDSAADASDNSYILGTDFLGRDIMSRLIYGARISLAIGLIPPLITLAIGTLLGMTAGYYGGKTDYLIMRLADICMSFPSLLLAMVVMYTLGASLFNIFIALSIVNWGGASRIIRAQTLSLKQKEFVEAARSMGVSKWKILWRHIFPNCIPSLIVLFTLSVPEAIMSEAGLSFLGVGAQPPMPSWGLMISRGKEYLFSSPWVAITPGIAIFLVVIAFNFIGDGLRDALDPYTKHD
jgi:ABC-type dipeptide/oligopeptide/nickel transport system permease subunit